MRITFRLALLLCALTAALPAAAGAAAVPAGSAVATPAVESTSPGAKTTSSTPDIGGTADTSGTTSGSAFAPLAAAPSGPAPNVLVDAPGLGPSSGVNPSDVGGAIGPEYFIQGVNATGIAVFRRSDLAPVAGPVPALSFANAPPAQEVVDAQFLWDEPSQRWFYSFTYKSADGTFSSSGLLYGWSKTADPTDLEHGWCQMKIDTGTAFEDRPKLSVSATHIVLGTNAAPRSGNWYSRVWTIPKPANGTTSCPTSAQTGIQTFGTEQQPLRSTDNTLVDSPVPAVASDGGSTVYVVAADDNASSNNQIMVWHVGSDGKLVADGNVSVNAYSAPPRAPQPSGYDSLDTIDQRLSNAVAHTDPDVGQKAVWAQQAIADPAGTGRSVVRWYELLPSACGGGTCTASARRQQGEVKDSSTWLFNAAISPTGAGNEAVVQYNSASSSQLAQTRASSRVSSTPLGAMSAPVTIATSDAPDQDFTCFDDATSHRPGCRWGDYSTATPDPNDPHVVWGSSPVIGTPPPPDGSGKVGQHWKSHNFAVQADADPALAHSATGTADSAPGGDGDGVVEPGESVDVSETVRNAGGSAATGISGTLQSLTPGLSVTSAASPYPNIAAGGTASGTSPFRVSAGSSLACGAPLAMSLTLDTAQGRYRVPVTVPTGKPGTEQSTSATGLPKSIPDNNATGVSSSITLGGSGTVSNVDVSIAHLTHTWDGDLQIELTGPDGTKVMLADRPGGINNGGDNFVNTVFSDSAATPLSAGTAPYTGTFKPQGGRLAAFAGKPLAGTWTLRVADVASNDTGTLDGWGLRTSAAGCGVAANVPPAASFTASPDPVATGTSVTFTSTSTDSDGSVASQAWDLDNDGQFDDGTGLTASTSFPKAGSYTVKLRVTDNRGATATASRAVTVTNRPPVASFTSAPATPNSGDSITFTSTSSDVDGTIASQAWDLDNDGAYDDSSAATASRSFPKGGTYTVGLRVTDDNGDSATTTRQVTVANRAPVAAFSSAPASPSTGDSITFTSSSSDPDGSVASQAWDLDNDGAYDDGSAATAARSFPKAGTYTVGLRVTDDSGTSTTISHTVTVANRLPVASFTSAPAAPKTADTVTFTSGSSDPDGAIASQAWDLDNDGQYDDGTAATASRSFAKPGTYTVGLKVTDDSGASTTVSNTVTIANRPPVGAFTSAPAAPKSGDTVTLTSGSSDPDGSIASQAWDLDNDGQYDDGSAATASRSFSKAGTYTVGLKVTDDSGASTTVSHTVTVANRPPAVGWSSAPASPKTADTVTFSSTASDPDGTIASQAWDLTGDGQFDDGTAATASRSFSKAGTYTVGLKATDDNGDSTTFTKQISIGNRAPTAAFSAAPNPLPTGSTVTFTSSSTDPDGTIASQGWDLDNDGQYDDATGSSASRSFAKAGTYTVGLKVTDDNGDSSTLQHTVTVTNRAPSAAFEVSPNPTSPGQSVTFTSTAGDPDGTIASQAWDLDNDGQYDDGTGATASRSFGSPGTFTVGLKVTDDDGGTATVSHTVTINNRAPTAAFGVDPVSPSTGDPVTFESTSSDPDGQSVSEAWDLNNDGKFDDGSGTTASRTFTKAGTYTIRLQATDTEGMSSVASHLVTVGGRPPVASFTVTPQSVETGQPASFDAAGSTDPDGTVQRYQWDLDGNGSYETDTGSNPQTSRFYADPGNVIVGLLVTDDDGKTAETQRTLTVTQAPPFADGPSVPPPDGGLPNGQPDPTPSPTPTPTPTVPRPRGSLRVLSHNLRTSLKRGLPLRFSSNMAATARFTLTAGSLKLGSAHRLIGAGRSSIRVKLARRPRGQITVKMTLISARGATRSYTLKTRLR
jgi:YD repeat-containing protein